LSKNENVERKKDTWKGGAKELLKVTEGEFVYSNMITDYVIDIKSVCFPDLPQESIKDIRVSENLVTYPAFVTSENIMWFSKTKLNQISLQKLTAVIVHELAHIYRHYDTKTMKNTWIHTCKLLEKQDKGMNSYKCHFFMTKTWEIPNYYMGRIEYNTTKVKRSIYNVRVPDVASVSEGFWLNSDLEFTINQKEFYYWVPPSQVLGIYKLGNC
jgi:hypothetical protein